MRRALFLTLCSIAIALTAGCRTIPYGATEKIVGIPAFSNSKAIIQNRAGRGVIIIPLKGGQYYPAEYWTGKRSPWCAFLCREKFITKAVAIPNGKQITVPLIANTASYAARKMTIELAVLENDRKIGSYLAFISIPTYGTATEYFVFDLNRLLALKNGDYGEPCRSDIWRY